MGGVNDKKGISGLSSLVSDIDEIVSESPRRPTQSETRISAPRRQSKRSDSSNSVSKSWSSSLGTTWARWFRAALGFLGAAFAGIGTFLLLGLLLTYSAIFVTKIFINADNEDARSTSELQQSSTIPDKGVSSQSSQLTLDVQNALVWLGYNPGPLDGLYGIRTKAAIQCFQREIGIADDGQVTQALLERIRHMPYSPYKMMKVYHGNYQDQMEGEDFETFMRRIDKSGDEKLVEDMATYMYKDKYSDYRREDYDSRIALTEWRRHRASRRQCG